MYSMYTGSTQGGFKSQVELSFLLYFFPPGRKEIQPRFKEILENLKNSSNVSGTRQPLVKTENTVTAPCFMTLEELKILWPAKT